MPELPLPPSPPAPFSKPRSHVNQLSATINPFPPRKIDLFIRLSITFYPPESLLCGLFRVIHYTTVNTPEGEASGGSSGERPPHLDIKSDALIPLGGGKSCALGREACVWD